MSSGVTDTTVLPEATGTALSVANAVCSIASLEGFSGVSISAGTLEAATRLNINDYLVRKPDETRYPNWKGPYLQQEVKTDPWDRAWVLNLQPLYCAETILDAAGTASALTSGNLGYAWILSGGTNKTVATLFTSGQLDPSGEDAGVNMGKILTRGAGGIDAN